MLLLKEILILFWIATIGTVQVFFFFFKKKKITFVLIQITVF